MSWKCCIVLTIGLMSFASTCGAAEVITGQRFAGGGVLAPSGKTAFLPNPTGGIDAIELATGNILWTAKDARKPLAAGSDRVFALQLIDGKANQIAIKILDAESGKVVRESALLVFPEWVSVSVTYGRSFQSSARLEDKSLLFVWDARAFYAGGARPTREIEAAARKSAQGAARIDLATGKVEELKDFKAKDGLFAGELAESKISDAIYRIDDRPTKDKRNPFQRSRFLVAIRDGKPIWEREIAAPVFLLPLP